LSAQILVLTQHLHPEMNPPTDAAGQILAVRLHHLLLVLLSAAAAAVCHEIGPV